VDILNLNWNWTKRDYLKNFPQSKICEGKICIDVALRGIVCKAILVFSRFRNKLDKAELIIPDDITQRAKPGSEIPDYLETFDILKTMLGDPKESGGSIDMIRDVSELSLDKLPKATWRVKDIEIVHTFKDYWGIIPYTYIAQWRR